MTTNIPYTPYPSGFVTPRGFIPVASTVDADGKPIHHEKKD